MHVGVAEHDVVAAVSRRFTASEITAALAFLQKQGLVNSSGVKRPLMLSKLFAEHLEVCLTLLALVHPSNSMFATQDLVSAGYLQLWGL